MEVEIRMMATIVWGKQGCEDGERSVNGFYLTLNKIRVRSEGVLLYSG